MSHSRRRKIISSVVFLVIVICFSGALYFLSLRPTPRPAVPNDATHRGLNDWKACLPCHGKTGTNPLPKKHPLKEDLCFRCHVAPTPDKTSP